MGIGRHASDRRGGGSDQTVVSFDKSTALAAAYAAAALITSFVIFTGRDVTD